MWSSSLGKCQREGHNDRGVIPKPKQLTTSIISNINQSMKTEITNGAVQAAREVYELLVSHFQTDEGVHVGTIVSAAARLAGTSLIRSFNFALNDLKPGTPILSEQANEWWPELVNILVYTLKISGVEIKQGWASVTTPEEHLPEKDLLQIQLELQEPYTQIMSRFALDYVQAAYAGTIACAMIIVETQNALDPYIACDIATYGFIDGTKTVPIPLASSR